MYERIYRLKIENCEEKSTGVSGSRFWCFPFRPTVHRYSHVAAIFGMQISEEHVLHHFQNVHRSRFLF